MTDTKDPKDILKSSDAVQYGVSHIMESLKITTVSTKDLIPYINNPKDHPEDQITRLVSSIKEFGFINPVVVDQDNVVVAGHGRLEAAKRLSMEEIPTIQVGHLTPAQIKAFRIADNRVAESGWIDDILKLEIEGLQEMDFDIELTGFDLDEIADFMMDPGEPADAEPQIDQAEELNKKWQVAPGQLWEIGEHRLLCGDSTKAEDVERVMGGEKADMVFTDPPYNVDYVGKTKDALKIANDAMTDVHFDQFLDAIFAAWPLRPGGSYYVCAPPGHPETQFRCALNRASGLSIRQCIVWVKNRFVMGRQDYQWRHETILYGWREGAAHYFINDHTQDTVWEIDRPSRSKEHPTMKPVDLPVKAIGNNTKAGETVWDGFLGSGTTLIAAENLKRRCFGIEISENYCAVILERMATAFPNLDIHKAPK